MADELISREAAESALDEIIRAYIAEKSYTGNFAAGVVCDIRDNLIAELPSVNAVVLPCKVGDTVYTPQDFGEEYRPFVDIGKVFAIGIDERNTMWVSVRYESGLTYYHTSDDIGKTVFLTKEEAEKALEGREDNG